MDTSLKTRIESLINQFGSDKSLGTLLKEHLESTFECPKCKGTGTYVSDYPTFSPVTYCTCEICLGKGRTTEEYVPKFTTSTVQTGWEKKND